MLPDIFGRVTEKKGFSFYKLGLCVCGFFLSVLVGGENYAERESALFCFSANLKVCLINDSHHHTHHISANLYVLDTIYV